MGGTQDGGRGLPEGPSPSSAKNRDGAGPRGQVRCQQHRSHMRVGHRNHFGSDYNFSVYRLSLAPLSCSLIRPLAAAIDNKCSQAYHNGKRRD